MSLIDRFTALFAAAPAPSPKPLPEADVPHALGALLVRVALSDKRYAVQEISQIDRTLSEFQGIGPIEAAKLRADSERLEAFAPDLPDFASLLCSTVPYETRLQLVEALWKVVYADGLVAQSESDMMIVTQDHLGVRTEDCADAQEKARVATLSPGT
jgi:uncharacterized tellurite resistance protein B-like protein